MTQESLHLIQESLDEAAGAPQASELIVAEAHHRIANNLALIASLTRLQARDLAAHDRAYSANEVQTVLAEVGARIDTVGRLHTLLSDSASGETLDLGGYLGEIAVSAIRSMGHATAPRFSAELRGGAFQRGQALQVGLIVGELVTNALKYAHPAGVAGEIRLVCRPSRNGMVVEVSDDGVGFPEGFDPERGGGLGLRIVRSLASRMNADLEFEDTGMGLTARLEIPDDRSKQD
ncbi:MAG TPA: sensor histidine kinase [Caulobacteraceae bacterium]